MEINKNELISVAGIDDLFVLVNTKGDMVYLKSLRTNKVAFFSMARNTIIWLFRIEIFGTSENIALYKLFSLMQKNETEEVPSIKDDKEKAFAYFLKIFPTLDKARVYHSNLKQIIKWYNIIKSFNLKFEE